MFSNNCVCNEEWGKKVKPFLTVMTPVYNRRETLQRTIRSVEKQTFRDIEYIIIDDGSTELVDDIVEKFMNSTDIPVMFVKKNNGGVHTARNIGYRQARGELVLCIDSDDELLPDACEIFYKTWCSIPKEQRKDCWQIKAQCVDENGKITGTLFPDNVNTQWDKNTWKSFSMSRGEQIGCRVAKIMKDNLFPEPEGVTFVTEGVKWIPLERKYRSWGINDVVRIYHTEGDNHLSKGSSKKTEQDLRNSLWNITFHLNNNKVFMIKRIKRLKFIGKYCVLVRLLVYCGNEKFVCKNKLAGQYNNFWKGLFVLPAAIIAKLYFSKLDFSKELRNNGDKNA